VYLWDGGPALVQTVDFFTPIVDDPFLYGQIAAANALSDIYAMGGRPLTALAIAAFPAQGLDPDVMSRVFRGGLEKLREAGVALLGGHTVRDNEIKFGYAVTGAVDPRHVLTNAGAQPGDVLVLTKPLGTGIVATAIKFDRAPAPSVEAAVSSMVTLNAAAAAAMSESLGAVHACTDITGFGLIGHASEMAAASKVTLFIDALAVPLLPGVLEMVAANRAGGMQTNQAYFPVAYGRAAAPSIAGAAQAQVDADRLAVFYDPQTSGGLLIAVESTGADRLIAALTARGVDATRIGHAEAFAGGPIILA
jgi:selenide,water dikinase